MSLEYDFVDMVDYGHKFHVHIKSAVGQSDFERGNLTLGETVRVITTHLMRCKSPEQVMSVRLDKAGNKLEVN